MNILKASRLMAQAVQPVAGQLVSGAARSEPNGVTIMRVSLPAGSRLAVLMVGLALAAALGWYLISPWYTLNRLAAAVEARDRDALARYVDYEALRADAKADLMRDMLGPLDADDAGSGEFGNLLADAMLGPTVEQVISPESLERAFGQEEPPRIASPAPAPGPEPVEMSLSGKLKIDRKGLSTFLAASENKPGVKAEFRRSYLSWRLSGIELPKNSKSSE